MGFIRRAKAKINSGRLRSFAVGENRSLRDHSRKHVKSYDSTESDDSLGERLDSQDQFEIAVPLKIRSPRGILRNGSGLSRKNAEEQSTTSSITMESNMFLPQQKQQLPVKTKSVQTPPPKRKEQRSVNRSDYSSCCGYSTATDETDDTNSLVEGEDNKHPRSKRRNDSSWLLCGGTTKEVPNYVEDDEIPHPSFMAPKPLRRDASLFDTLEEEPEEEEETETEEDDDDEMEEPVDDYTMAADTQYAVAESVVETESIYSNHSDWEEKRRSFRLPKVPKVPKELVRSLSKVRRSRSFQRIASFGKSKSKKNQLQQYVVEP